MSNNEPQRPRLAGGIFIALGLLGGAIIGVVYGQPSAGMVGGLALGGAAALLVWFVDSKRV